MEVYEQLRHFADSWGLLLMTVFFVAAMAWVLRAVPPKTAATQRYSNTPRKSSLREMAVASPRASRNEVTRNW